MSMRAPTHWIRVAAGQTGARFICALVCLTLLGGCERDARSPDRRFLSIGTAGTGGIYYPLGGALASRLSAVDPVRRYTAEVTGGSVENIKRITSGEMDLAFAIGTSVYEAYHGGQDFLEPHPELRVVAPLYPNLTHALVPASSTVQSIAELRGKRVSVGAAGSGTEQVVKHLLEAHGLSYDDIDERYLSFTESAAALADAAIDAAILSVGYPASAVLEVTTTGRARLLRMDARVAAQIADRFSYYQTATIPAGAYPRVDADVLTVSVLNWIVARADLPDEVVILLLDILRGEADELRRVVDIAGQINLTNLHAAPIPLHPAVRQWLEDAAPR
jgi:TRAP transporter TAXI family solute receptor